LVAPNDGEQLTVERVETGQQGLTHTSSSDTAGPLSPAVSI